MREVKILHLIRFILLSISLVAGQNYVWPTEASKVITATFGDIRPSRYHAGFDISTKGGTGYAIYAVEDGFIERVRLSSEGYGRTLYLRLTDHRVAVYAHLQRFDIDLQEHVLAQQGKAGKYAVDLRFKPRDFPVKKGAVIGYTGDTGTINGPHLHFELRDRQNRPLNPLTNGFEFDDPLLPEFARLALIPLSIRTVTHGSVLTAVIRARRVARGRYVIDDTLAVTGRFGLAVEAFDRAPGNRYHHTVYGLSLEVDSVQLYAIEFERHRFDQGKLSELERDYGLWRRTDDDFHRLFRHPSNDSLSFIAEGSDGQLDLEAGYHPFTIKAWDKNGNLATLTGILANTPPTEISATARYSELEKGWVVAVESTQPLREYHAFLFDVRGNQVETFSYRTKDPGSKTQQFVIPKASGRRKIIQIIGVDKWGARLEPVHVSLIPVSDVTMMRTFSILTQHAETGVNLQVHTNYYLPQAPEVLLRTPDRILRYPTKMVGPVDFLTPTLPLSALENLVEIIVRVELETTYEVRLPIRGTVATPGNWTKLTTFDDNATLEFRPGTVYDSTWVRFEHAEVPAPDSGQYVLPPLKIEPLERPFRGPMGLEFRIPANQLLPENAAIYIYDEQDGWDYLDPAGKQSPDDQLRSRAYRGLLDRAETVALIEEHIAPEIQFKRPGQGGRYTRGDVKSIRIKIVDRLAGIDNETAITLELDGVPRIFEYNRSRDQITYVIPGFLESGEHEIFVRASDQVGNTASKTIRFIVD